MLVPSIYSDLVNSFFGDFGDDYRQQPAPAKQNTYGISTDVKEYEDHYKLYMELPGYDKQDIKVELKDGYLVVSAEKGLDEDEKDKKSGKYLRRERYAGSCQRSYYVGKDTTEDDIKAHFEHGMLTVTVAKKEAKPAVEEKKHIAIEG